MLLQVATDAIFEQDERFDQHFSLGRIDRIEHGWKIRVAVFQQLNAIAADPFDLQLHSCTSPTRGAWSDNVAHGRRGNCNGRCRRLRT